MKKSNLLASVALVSAGILTAATAQAQQAPAAQGTTDETPEAQDADRTTKSDDIVVTARRSEERLLDVPIAVAVIRSEDLASANIVNSFDLAMRVPALNATNILGSTSTTFSLRGFTQDIGGNPTVGVYFADVVAPRGMAPSNLFGDGAGPGSFYDLENVQVLKGPQGTLFGRNTTGGAVLLTPKAPTDRFEGYIEGSVGNYNMKRVQAVMNIPFSDAVALRVGFDGQNRDGYLRNTTGVGPDRFNDVGYISTRATLRVDLSPEIRNVTTFTWNNVDQNGDIQQAFYADPNNRPTGALVAGQINRARGAGFYSVQNGNPLARTQQTTWQIINSTSWDVSDHFSFKNIISYASLKNSLNGAIFGTYVDLSDINTYLASIGRPVQPVGTYAQLSGGIIPFPNGISVNQRTFTEEFRIQGDTPDGRLDYQAGVYLEVVSPTGGQTGTTSFGFLQCGTHIEALICANPSGFGSAGQVSGETRSRGLGVYAQASYKIVDALTLTGGIRYTWDKASGTGVNRRFTFPTGTVRGPSNGITCTLPNTVAPACEIRTEQRSKAPTWVLSLDYKPSADSLIYAKWARGYRAGGIQLQDAAPLNTYAQERLDTYEVGAKFATRGSVPASLNIAAFYNDFSNQQIQISLLPTLSSLSQLTAIFNTGTSKIYGAEIDGSIRPFDGLSLRAAYAYLHTEITAIDAPPTFVGFPYTISNPARVGDRLRQTPKHKLSLNADYTLPLDESIGTITIGGGYTYVGDQLTNYIRRDTAGQLTGNSVIPSRELIDAHIDWKGIAGTRLDLSIFGTNLGGERYWTYVTDASVFAARQIGQPRMYGGRVRYSF